MPNLIKINIDFIMKVSAGQLKKN